MIIIKHKNIFFALTGLIMLLSLASFIFFGLKLGTDFTGGTLAQVTYANGRPSPEALQASLEAAGISGYSLREANTNDYILRAGNLTPAERSALPNTLSLNGKNPVSIDQLTEVGPTIGTELRNKALIALTLVLLCILLFIAFAFRKVSKPVSSWIYGLIALVTLIHDVIVPVGFYAALGHFAGAQVDTLFVTAVLTVLGFSIHDTIVVFDRVRENLRLNEERNRREDFAETAGRSLNQTFVRSINTSLTVLVTLLILFAIGPASTTDFALTLLVGIVAGTYSSIFLATPLLVLVEQRRRQKRK
ncbi:protein-export membrane protein SecF [Candidatus Kaiserbacteria bacterium RIFCSPHIGHO2_01_FULL_54_36b]|uniref:Protein-export membrane protein SecF n=1 Tax=Candidatus Kaiserbacteria bacterium RIFCSPHIGHO2_01_FULL_54_36b TaxID=1798483 RepID=A0A1F6CPP9_9BACT|nr:MAG: protein-export membrane protein SecF [Candidatus Kaiserbacteria bacterium RIFCSPHIGHO2_01_FULL_54_36b]